MEFGPLDSKEDGEHHDEIVATQNVCLWNLAI